MPAWEAIELVRFRGVEKLILPDLRPINLLVGRNNSGKTTVLEAAAVLCNPLDIWTWLDTPRLREMKSARTPPEEGLRFLFPQTDSTRPEQIPFQGHLEVAATTKGTRMSVAAHLQWHRVEAPADTAFEPNEPMLFRETDSARFVTLFTVSAGDEPPLFETLVEGLPFKPNRPAPKSPRTPYRHLTSVTHRTEADALATVSRSIEAGGKPQLLQLLGQLDPRIEEIEVLDLSGRRSVVKLGRKGIGFLPLSCEGDGIRRALIVGSAAFEVAGGVLLLDEFETALHASGLETVMRAVLGFCRQLKVQVFATTHSLEAIDAVSSALVDCPEDLAIYRLPDPGTGADVKRFGGLDARRIREDRGLDLR